MQDNLNKVEEDEEEEEDEENLSENADQQKQKALNKFALALKAENKPENALKKIIEIKFVSISEITKFSKEHREKSSCCPLFAFFNPYQKQLLHFNTLHVLLS